MRSRPRLWSGARFRRWPAQLFDVPTPLGEYVRGADEGRKKCRREKESVSDVQQPPLERRDRHYDGNGERRGKFGVEREWHHRRGVDKEVGRSAIEGRYTTLIAPTTTKSKRPGPSRHEKVQKKQKTLRAQPPWRSHSVAVDVFCDRLPQKDVR